MLFNQLSAQNVVYNKEGDDKEFVSEEIDILFSDSGINIPHSPTKESTPALAISALPTIIDISFKLVTKWLEERAKEFTGEYSKSQSYLNIADRQFPNFEFTRQIQLENEENLNLGLDVKVKVKKLDAIEAVVLYIDSISLKHSMARVKDEKTRLDYIFEFKPSFYLPEEKKKEMLEIAPITISAVEFGENDFPELKHRSEIIFLPTNALFTGISIKIVETNPQKVRAEKILSVWNENKEDVKTIVNQIVPDEDGNETQEGKDNGDQSEDNDAESEGDNGTGKDTGKS